MKHPIMYRVAMYSIIAALCACIFFIIDEMKHMPYSSKHMRAAYFYGCILGSRFSEQENFEFCTTSADIFKETVDSIEQQIIDNEEKMSNKTQE